MLEVCGSVNKGKNMYELMVSMKFSAAHYLKGYDGACRNVHGHNYKVEVFLEGNSLQETAMLVDFKQIKKYLADILERLDHQLLNEVLDFNPTAERMAEYIFGKLDKKLPVNCKLAKVAIWENDDSRATFIPEKEV